MTENLALETKDLTKSYDGATGVLGPNGAGKTTTILMLLGLTEPASGTARVCGFNPTREPLKVKRVVGYLPEAVGFYDNLNARDNLKFIAELNNISREETSRRIDEVLAMVGLSEEKDLVVGKYSRGMRQRLGIADVLIKQPKVVFLDEPTSGLDPKGINQLLDLIASLPKMGTTVLLSSHQLYQVQKVCHRAKESVLRVSTNADLRAQISKAVVQNDIPLVQMKMQEFSLDDIYMKYFKES